MSQTFKNMLRTYKAKQRRTAFIFDSIILYKIMEMLCVSANVRKCNIAYSVVYVRPMLTIMFKNVLRTFEAEILKILKSIQPRPTN